MIRIKRITADNQCLSAKSASSACYLSVVLYSINKRFRVINRDIWQNAVTKVGNVFIGSKVIYHLLGQSFNFRNWAQQTGRVKIPLKGNVEFGKLTRHLWCDGPIHAKCRNWHLRHLL